MPLHRSASAGPGGRGGFNSGQNEAREAQDAHFWELQEQFAQQDALRGCLPKKGFLKLQQEEQELFGNVVKSGIDFDRYDNIEVERSGKAASRIPVGQSFGELFGMFKVPGWLKDNVERCGYCKPTPVQKYAIPAALVGRDIMVCAQTGSGKTAAFLVPLIAAVDLQKSCEAGETFKGPARPFGLIMSPTRELCQQIHLEARKLTFKSILRVQVVYGGVTAWHQIKDLARGVDVLTATPGRLQDYLSRGLVSLSCIEFCVLDEADRMLDMGFEPEIRKIILHSDMPSSEGHQTMLFSATFASEIQLMAQDFLYEYVWICIGRVGGANESVTQRLVRCRNSEKAELLLDLLHQDPGTDQRLAEGEPLPLTIVFCGMKKSCSWLTGHLQDLGIAAGTIHGEREQWEREQTLKEFRAGEIRCLVASDVAARGLDIPKVARVVNYDLPGSIDDYVHRIGRTGRAGHRGVAVSFFVVEPEHGVDAAGRSLEINNLNLAPALQELLAQVGTVPDWLEDASAQQAERLAARPPREARSKSTDARRRAR